MPIKFEIKLTFDGPFNVGAGALGGSLADKPLIRDARGLPMVPASAFKGRLRHEVERLVPILLPDAPPPCSAPVAETMCQGEQDPCPVCRLFGSPGYPGRLTFSDLILTEPDFLRHGQPPPGDLRYGVGLSRQRRVAEDKLLYTTEVFLPGTPLTLSTLNGSISGDLNDQEQELLRAALESLFTVGGGKTKGLGWFELDLTISEEPGPVALASAANDVEAEWLEVIVELTSPLLLGTDADEANYKTTRTYIPGGTLRGALAQKMLAACPHEAESSHQDCDFGRLFSIGQPPVFEYLYPTTPRAREFALPAPLTARSCKYHPGFQKTRREEEKGHGVGDILIRQTVFEAMLDQTIPLPFLYQPRCPECQAEVDRFEGFMLMVQSDLYDNLLVPVRRTSRTAIDRKRAVAADGQLYTLEMIEPMDNQRRPIAFRGRVRASPGQLAVLAHWLPQLSAIGRSNTSGFGEVKVEVLLPANSSDPLPALSQRLEEFNQAVREEWSFYERMSGVEPLPDDTLFFSLNLLSPAVLTWCGLPVTVPSPEMMGLEQDVRLQRAFAAYQTMGGWHLGANLPRRTQQTIVMGSVFLYRVQGLTLDQLADKLAPIEANGLGEDRSRGLGRVAFCLPFHYQSEVTL